MQARSPHFVLAGDVVHEDNPWTRNEWLSRPDMAASDKLMMIRATMPSGCCHPFHHHPHREEIIHVVSGRAEQWVGTEHRILGPGEVAVIPAGMVHATYNPFPEPVVFHAILSPAALEAPLDRDEDPRDVSLEEPWRSLRKGMTPCSILSEIDEDIS